MVATEKKPKARKTLSLVVEGVVERADLKSRAPFHRNFYVPAEQLEFYLDVCVRQADGSAAYFTPGAVKRTVTAVPGAAVVCYSVDGEAAKWLVEEGREKSVATSGAPNENRLVPLVKVGDRVRVQGRLKAHKLSKYQNRYVLLTHVHRDPPADAASDPLPPPVR